MPKGFNLHCAAGKTARVWLQGKGGGLKPGQAAVLLPPKEGETDESPVGLSRAAAPGADRRKCRPRKRRRLGSRLSRTQAWD